jgi:hypothetical protein
VSGFRAIAGVSSTLRNLLRDRLEDPVSVTIAPPDVQVNGATGRRVNLYLYLVTENGFLRNQEIPGQGHPADYGRPPLSLNLHYLMTAFGSADNAADSDLEAQQILGDAMRVFHDFPIVTEDLHQGDILANPRILDPTLVGEFEKVKISLQPTSLEEVTDLWMALPQSNFRRSVAYQVTVVQIESLRPRRSSLPVRERRVYAFPFRSPKIDEIVRDPLFPGAAVPGIAEVGDTILIRGTGLRAAGTRVAIGDLSTAIANPGDTQITMTVPAGIAAGVHPVQLVQDLLLDAEPGQPPVAHRGFASNVVPLLVVPQLVGIAPPGPAAAGATVTVTVNPPAAATQHKVLLLDDFAVPAAAVSVDAPASATIDFVLPANTPGGTHFVRIRVDGAESRLTINPVTTQYDGPTYATA